MGAGGNLASPSPPSPFSQKEGGLALDLEDLFLNSFFLLFQMPVPRTAGQGQEPVRERGGLVAAGLGHAARAFGPANGVFDLDAAAGVGHIVALWGTGQGGVGAFLAASGLAMGQAFGRQAVVGDRAQVAQTGQQLKEAEQARIDIECIFKQLVVVGGPAGGRPQVVDVAGRVGAERVFTGVSFILPE